MSDWFAWLDAPYARVATAIGSARHAHAYLLSGPAGLGKTVLAARLANFALCESPQDSMPCGDCRSCVLIAAGNHPDLRTLEPEEAGKAITVDQARELIDFFTLRAHYGAHKVAVIAPAEQLNRNAANALLKLVEEPPAGAMILFVTARPARLPQTLRSRCQNVALTSPDDATTAAWLAAERQQNPEMRDPGAYVLSGAPLERRAQLCSESGPPYDGLIDAMADVVLHGRPPLETARAHTGRDARSFLDDCELVVAALGSCLAGATPTHLQVPEKRAPAIAEIAEKLGLKRIFLLLDHIAESRALVLRSSGVRGAEIIENVFLSLVAPHSEI